MSGGKVTAQQLQENLELMNQQVIRLIDFCNTMKQVTSMEELEVHRRETRLEEISKKVQDMAEALNGTRDISVSFSSCLLSGRGWIMDEMVVMEVLENLVSNALRYALTKVEITLDESEDGRKMIFYVQDDGPGFTREDCARLSVRTTGIKRRHRAITTALDCISAKCCARSTGKPVTVQQH